MGQPLSQADWAELLGTFEHSALRREVQATYVVTYEQESVDRFLAGNPQPPSEVPEFRAWFDHVADVTRRGGRVGRVRVHDDPPTDYQRWLRWLGRWNAEAGEDIRYLDRSWALELGLDAATGSVDWWLLDSTRLVVMRFAEGRRVDAELVTEAEAITQACAWWDLAVHHATADPVRGGA